MKNVILTGGTGMLGIALTNYLIKKEINVTLIINPNSKRLKNIPVDPKVQVVECDLHNLCSLENSLEHSYDTFFHFGWMGTFGDARNDMYLQNENIKCTLDAIELANKIGCRIFLGAGSQAEYGRADGKIAPDTVANPENGYGIAKLCAGQMSRIVCQKYGIKHIWVRILSTYGPFDGKHTMVMSGLSQMIGNQRPSFTKGEQMWDYLYCEDAAEAFYLAAEKGKAGSIYCLGSGQVQPLYQYIETIRDVVNPKLKLVFGEVPYSENQVMYLCADIQKLTEDTGFIPKTSFRDGIKKTMEWLQGESM